VALALLFTPTVAANWWAFGLTVLVIWMDGLDGYAARKLNECSTAGAVVDILADRTVEQLYWVVFACLGWVPVWMPLVIITRGVWVDGLRALALQQGFTAFGQHSLMQSPLGVLLVSSRFSRFTYAVVKALFFAVAIVAHQGWPQPALGLTLTHGLAWATVVFCLLRGLPVLVEAFRFMKPA
jgi:phosphatidylglycerophosphate synthase